MEKGTNCTSPADYPTVKVMGVPCYVFRAIDDLGQVIDVYVSPTRDTDAAVRFLRRAVERTGVHPHTATTDKAAIYPPALARVLPTTIHITGKAEQQQIERNHQHLKGRYQSMRGFKTLPAPRPSVLDMGSCGTSGTDSTGWV